VLNEILHSSKQPSITKFKIPKLGRFTVGVFSIQMLLIIKIEFGKTFEV
jgi:hypothetical protein